LERKRVGQREKANVVHLSCFDLHESLDSTLNDSQNVAFHKVDAHFS